MTALATRAAVIFESLLEELHGIHFITHTTIQLSTIRNDHMFPTLRVVVVAEVKIRGYHLHTLYTFDYSYPFIQETFFAYPFFMFSTSVRPRGSHRAAHVCNVCHPYPPPCPPFSRKSTPFIEKRKNDGSFNLEYNIYFLEIKRDDIASKQLKKTNSTPRCYLRLPSLCYFPGTSSQTPSGWATEQSTMVWRPCSPMSRKHPDSTECTHAYVSGGRQETIGSEEPRGEKGAPSTIKSQPALVIKSSSLGCANNTFMI